MNTLVQKKVCLLGDFGVGKTSLVRRFVENRFEDKYLSTIGVKISRKNLARPYGEMNMLVWDLAGSNGFDIVSNSSYTQGAAGALIVCDLTRRETLLTFEEYARQIRRMNPDIHIVFVCNKFDLTDERVISDADLSAVSSTFGDGMFFLTSAKTGEQVEESFISLADKIDAGSQHV
jgi:small GTP-binding protein